MKKISYIILITILTLLIPTSAFIFITQLDYVITYELRSFLYTSFQNALALVIASGLIFIASVVVLPFLSIKIHKLNKSKNERKENSSI